MEGGQVSRLKVPALLLLASFVPPAFPQAKKEGPHGPPPPWEKLPGIRKQALRFWIETLAAPGMKGREAGTPGFDAAADFVRDRLRKWGLPSPPGVKDYFQPIPLLYLKLGKPARFLVDGKPMRLFRDFVPRQDSADGHASGIAVGVGLGFSSPELGVDFLAGKNLKGKIAVIDRDAWKGLRAKYYSLPYAKRLELRNRLFRRGAILKGLAERGAVGAVSFRSSPPRYSPRSGRFRTGSVDQAGHLAFFEGVQIAQAFPPTIPGVEVTYRVGRSLEGRRVEMEVHLFRQARETHNIMAEFPGKRRGGKTVVLGAHLDGRGTIMVEGKPLTLPGANNNASGCAVLLEVARVLALRRPKLDNRLLLVFFSAREKYLAGSRTFVSRPPYPLSGFLAMVNLEGLARGLEEARGGVVAEYPPGMTAMARLFRKAAALAGLPFALHAHAPSFGADHWSFHDRRIPFLFLHGDLSDFDFPKGAERALDYDLLLKAARAVYDLALTLGRTKNLSPPSSRK